MKIKLALTGFGNVGQGVAILLRDRIEQYRKSYDVDLRLVGVADRRGATVNPLGLDPAAVLDAKSSQGTVAADSHGVPDLMGDEFLAQTEADVLLETTSSNYVDGQPAWQYVQAAARRHMHIVLASKGALVLHYGELMEEAQRNGVRVRFGGTVGAPLPLMELTERALIGAHVISVEAILNGTSNQILKAMSAGATYDEGVRQAQKMGIAETDPTLDVDGWDAAAKAVIVANAVLGGRLILQDVERRGIGGVTREQLTEAQRSGNAIKLMMRASTVDGKVTASVGPDSLPAGSFLGRLDGAGMGVVLRTDILGDVSASAEAGITGINGGMATALTVLRDVVYLSRDATARWSSRE